MFELTVVLIPGIRSEATPWRRTPRRPTGQDETRSTDPEAARPSASHFEQVQQRRTDTEGEALLTEALARLHAEQGRAPAPPNATSPTDAPVRRFRLVYESQQDPVAGPTSLPSARRYCPGRPSRIRIFSSRTAVL
jgi:hypothetical protein